MVGRLRAQRPALVGAGVVVIAIVAGVVALGLRGAPSAPGNDLRQATATLISSLKITSASQIYAVRDPYPAGRYLRIRPEYGNETSYTTTAPTWFFMIDDTPTQRLGHPVRYAFLAASGRVDLAQALWFARIGDVPGWRLETAFTATDVLVGVLAPLPPPTSSLPIDLARAAAAFTSGVDHLRDVLGDSVAYAAGRKVALVLDGGDGLIDVPSGLGKDCVNPVLTLDQYISGQPQGPCELVKKLGRIELRNKMAEEGDNVGVALDRDGFQVTRYSGSLSNVNPAADPETVHQAILKAKANLRPGDEFVLYVDPHGVPVETNGKPTDGLGLALCGKAGACSLLPYTDLAKWVGELDPGVKKVIGLDACFSGGAIDALRNVSGTEVFAAAAKDKTALGGVGPGEEDFTDAFLKAPPELSLEDRLTAAARSHQGTGATVSLGEGLFGASVPTFGPTATPTLTASATAVPTGAPGTTAPAPVVTTARPTLRLVTAPPVGSPAAQPRAPTAGPGTTALPTPPPATPTPAPTATAPATFDIDRITSPMMSQWADRNGGRLIKVLGCDRYGVIPIPAVATCQYTDSTGASGTIVMTINADATWSWADTTGGAPPTAAPVSQPTNPVGAPPTTAPPDTATVAGAQIASKTCGAAVSPYASNPSFKGYPITLVVKAQGPVGTYLQAGYVKPQDCGSWSAGVNECDRLPSSPPTTTATWTGYLNVSYPTGGMSLGPDTGSSLYFSCP